MRKRLNSILFSFFIFAVAGASAGVPTDATEVQPLERGDALPDVSVRTANGEKVSLTDLAGGRTAAFVFYRGGWCPYCNEHLSELAEVAPELQELGYRIFAISPDRSERVAEMTAADSSSGYTLISDSTSEAAKAFGVAFRVDDETYQQLHGFGIDIEEASGEKHRVLPVPAVFLVDGDGVITFRYYNPDYRERLSGEALLEAAALTSGPDRLAVLWTSGDPDVAHRVALMYAEGAMQQGWFSEVRLIVWGPSQRLLVADKDVRDYVERLQEAGVEVVACVACANSYGLADQLADLGFEVKPMGMPLTRYLRAASWQVLSF